MMAAVHLLRPYWLLALLPIALLWWWYGLPHQRASAWNRVMQADFVRLLVTQGTHGSGHRLAPPRHLLALACAVAVVALAGPVLQHTPQGVYRSRTALIIAVDLSQSMLAQDVTPSRLERAQLKTLDLLSLRQRGDTALIAYAAQAYAATPLTYDTRTLANLVPALSPRIMPRQGDNPRAALALSARLIQGSGRHGGDVLLLTDGLGGHRVQPLIAYAHRHGLRVSVLAVATPQPTPVPAPDGVGTLQNHGRPVTSALDAGPLKQLVHATGGHYQAVRRDSRDVQQLQKLFATQHGDNTRVAGRTSPQWRNLGPWLLLLLCLPASLYLFRRNLLFLLVTICLLTPLAQSHAAGLGSMFQNRNQQGLAAYRSGHYQAAGKLFSDPRWRAAAAYRQGDLKTALSLYAGQNDLASIYDRGNVLVKLGRLQQGLAAYNKVLARDPGNADAAYNKAQVLKLLKALNRGQSSSRPGKQSDKPNHSHNKKKNRQKDRQQDRDKQNASTAKQQSKPPQSAQAAKKEKAGRKGQALVKNSQRQNKRSSSLEATQTQKQQQRDAAQYRLRQIPDDPAGLLRRKFRYEYQQRAGQNRPGESP